MSIIHRLKQSCRDCHRLKWIYSKGRSQDLNLTVLLQSLWLSVLHFLCLVEQHAYKCTHALPQQLWKPLWRFLRKVKVKLLYDPEVLFLCICPKEIKLLSQRGICSSMFTAALFIIAKVWKQPKYSSLHEWVEKMRCMYTTKYHSVFTGKGIPPLGTSRINLEDFMISEMNQTQQDGYCIISLTCAILKMKKKDKKKSWARSYKE